LQITHYLTLAFEQAYLLAERPVSAELVESVLPPDLDDPQARLARHGYDAGILPPGRAEEIHKQLLAKGIVA
jgi:hypothetical protein